MFITCLLHLLLFLITFITCINFILTISPYIFPSIAEAFIELLGAVLRSVEALLCRQKSQDLHATLPPNTRDCDQPAGSSPAADANMCFTRVRLKHLFNGAAFLKR